MTRQTTTRQTMIRQNTIRQTVPLLVAFLLFAGMATAQQRPQKSAGADLPDRALMQKIMDAWATMNPHDAAKYYDQSADDVFFDDAGGVKFVGWQAYEDGIRKVLTSEQTTQWSVNDDAVVHRAGDYAWGTATVHTEYVYKNGVHQVMEERWTLIWARKQGNWLVVHEHFSAPPADVPQ